MQQPITGSATFCWLCGKAVSLEDGKTDESSHIVHEDCYVTCLILKSAAKTPPAAK